MRRNENVWAIMPEHLERVLRALHPQHKQAPSASVLDALAPRTSTPPAPYTLMRGVAVIDIRGAITRTEERSCWTGEKISQGQDTLLLALRAALTDNAARSILFAVDSPGGVVAGTKEVADAIAQARKQKPCAAYVDGLCASAAYWLAAATGRVLAPVTAQVGSIGVLMVHTDWSAFYENAGVKISYLTAGKFKADGFDNKPMSDEERQRFEAQLAQLHEIFKADVVRGMGISADPAAWAEGQTLLAEDALRTGLVSGIVRDMDAAISQLSAEVPMTRDELMAQAPELARALIAEGKEQATAEAAGQNMAQDAAKQQALLALVSAVAGAEAAEKVKNLAALHFTPEQIAAMQAAGMFAGASAASTAAASADPKQAILAELKAANSKQLPAASAPASSPQNRLAGAVDRIAAKAR